MARNLRQIWAKWPKIQNVLSGSKKSSLNLIDILNCLINIADICPQGTLQYRTTNWQIDHELDRAIWLVQKSIRQPSWIDFKTQWNCCAYNFTDHLISPSLGNSGNINYIKNILTTFYGSECIVNTFYTWALL